MVCLVLNILGLGIAALGGGLGLFQYHAVVDAGDGVVIRSVRIVRVILLQHSEDHRDDQYRGHGEADRELAAGARRSSGGAG